MEAVFTHCQLCAMREHWRHFESNWQYCSVGCLFFIALFLPKSLKNYHITCTIMYGSNRNGKPIDEFNMCNMTKNTPKCIEYGMLTGLNGSELSTV